MVETKLTEATQLDANAENFFRDLEAIRLAPEDTADVGTREILLRVPVRRPRREEFVRCHPDPVMSLMVTIYVDKDERDEFTSLRPTCAAPWRKILSPCSCSLRFPAAAHFSFGP